MQLLCACALPISYDCNDVGLNIYERHYEPIGWAEPVRRASTFGYHYDSAVISCVRCLHVCLTVCCLCSMWSPDSFYTLFIRAATISRTQKCQTCWFQPLKCEDLLLFLDFWFYKRSSLKQAAQICLVSWAWFDINGWFIVVMQPLVALVTLNKAEWCSMTVCWTDMKVARR